MEEQGESKGNLYARPTTLWVALALMALALVFAVWRMQPPAHKGGQEAPEQFSGARAGEIVGQLLGEEIPHPVGTPRNDEVMQAIIDKMSALGYQVETQKTTACRGGWYSATCAHVKNLIAQLPGQQNGPSVLYMAHYDSQPAAPGAADDLSNVAAMIEIARIMQAHGPYRNTVVFLFTDAEEVGLMGAQAFVDQHPLAKNVGAVINLEARGTSGQGLMFETSDDNAWLIGAFARSVPMPVSSSLFYEIYKILPNDTDFTVFKRAGIPGLNFAYIENPQHYHSPLDNLQNLDWNSVHHQGQSALAVGQELAMMGLSNPPSGNAIYIDLLGFTLLKWPQAWNIPLATLAVILLLAAAIWLARHKETTVGALLLGILSALLSTLLAIGLGMGLTALIRLVTSEATPWYAYPVVTRIAVWAGALLSGFLLATLFARKAGWWGLWLGAWLLWALISLALSVAFPGGSVVVFTPVIAATILIVLVAFTKMRKSALDREIGAILAAVSAGALWMTIALRFEAAVSFEMNQAITLWVAMVATTLAPFLALPPGQSSGRKWLLIASGTVTVVATLAAIFTPPYSEYHLQPLIVSHFSDRDSGEVYYIGQSLGTFPASFRSSFDSQPRAVLPWSDEALPVASAPPIASPTPEMQILSDTATGSQRLVSAILRSPRGGYLIELYIPLQALLSISVNDYTFEPQSAGSDDGYFYLKCPACDGQPIELRFNSLSPVEILLVDYSVGLPPEAASFIQARPATAAPFHWGDRTFILKRVVFGGE